MKKLLYLLLLIPFIQSNIYANGNADPDGGSTCPGGVCKTQVKPKRLTLRGTKVVMRGNKPPVFARRTTKPTVVVRRTTTPPLVRKKTAQPLSIYIRKKYGAQEEE